ncbi:MAG: TRAM domain-containing protein [archaeon]
MRDNMGNTAPVQEGEELEVKIEAIGDKGDGIAKKDGFVLVVPGTKAGETVTIKVTKVLRKVGFAEVVGRSENQSSEESDEPEQSEESEESEESAEEPQEDSEDFGDEE